MAVAPAGMPLSVTGPDPLYCAMLIKLSNKKAISKLIFFIFKNFKLLNSIVLTLGTVTEGLCIFIGQYNEQKSLQTCTKMKLWI